MSVWGDLRKKSLGQEDRIEKAEANLVKRFQDQDGFLNDTAINVSRKTFEDKDEFRDFARSIGSGQIQVDEQAEQWFTDEDALALKAFALQSFEFGGFKSIMDLLGGLGVDIRIEPGIKKHELPKELAEAWDKEDVELWERMPIRGEYHPKDKVIVLYPEEMHSEYNGERMNELLFSTLAHEAMHAYFNRKPRNELPYVIPVEEPMAEFGMLLCLYETNMVSFYNWARDDVSAKKTCYRYGVALMDQCLREGSGSRTRKDLESYKTRLI